MYRILCRKTFTICGAVALPEIGNTSESLTIEDKHEKWNRVKKIFYIDEFGEVSPQLNTMLQTTMFTGIFGCFYGGFLGARDTYFKFIERNEATKFADHFEAKKKLQESVTMGFGRGAMRWGPRLALFGGFYISFVTVFAAYRGSSGVLDFTLAGFLSGAIYRIHMGLKAIVAAGTLGGMMGMFAGALSSLLFKITGSSFDDIQQYTTEITSIRTRHYDEAVKKTRKEDVDELMELHNSVLQQTATKNLDPSK